MKVPFQTVDVFTDRQFGGNPVAVIPDARGLSGAQMQAIAAPVKSTSEPHRTLSEALHR